MVNNQNLGKRIGENVRRLRNIKKITQEKLSEKSGVSVNTIRNIEKGRWPSERTLRAVADALETEAKFLLSSEKDQYFLREEVAGKFQDFLKTLLRDATYSMDHFTPRS